MARRPVAEGNPRIIEAALAAIDEIDIWARDHHEPYAKELAASLGIPQKVSDLWVARSTFGAKRVDAAILAEQQKIAEFLREDRPDSERDQRQRCDLEGRLVKPCMASAASCLAGAVVRR